MTSDFPRPLDGMARTQSPRDEANHDAAHIRGQIERQSAGIAVPDR